MKVEWLNDDRTMARITVGWWRKRQALVRRAEKCTDGDCCSAGNHWRFVESGARYWRGSTVEWRRQDEIAAADWHPVVSLPAARLLKP